VCVPDQHTIVKTIRLSETGSTNLPDRLQFELIQSLLEDAALFQFDQAPSGIPERHLGFIWRKEYLTELTSKLGLTEESTSVPVSYRARSIALGRGFLAVCDGRDDNLMFWSTWPVKVPRSLISTIGMLSMLPSCRSAVTI